VALYQLSYYRILEMLRTVLTCIGAVSLCCPVRK